MIDHVNVDVLEDFQKYVVLVFDEMKIKKLVYSHNSGMLNVHRLHMHLT